MVEFLGVIQMKTLMAGIFLVAGTLFSQLAQAASVAVQATLVPQEQIRLDFKDGSGHFVLMVRREGWASGTGIWDGAQVVEYGRHDIVPGVSGDPSGYLLLTKGEGNTAYLKWTVRAVFLPGQSGQPEVNDNGFWEVVSGTGAFKTLKGAGTLHIKAANSTDRIFLLEGQVTGSN